LHFIETQMFSFYNFRKGLFDIHALSLFVTYLGRRSGSRLRSGFQEVVQQIVAMFGQN